MALRHYFLSNVIYCSVNNYFRSAPSSLPKHVIYEDKILYLQIVDLCIRIYLHYFYLH